MRIDAEQFSRSKMSYYIDMAIVSAEEIVPAPPEKCRHIEGFPAGSWINNVSWSPDGDKIVSGLHTCCLALAPHAKACSCTCCPQAAVRCLLAQSRHQWPRGRMSPAAHRLPNPLVMHAHEHHGAMSNLFSI